MSPGARRLAAALLGAALAAAPAAAAERLAVLPFAVTPPGERLAWIEHGLARLVGLIVAAQSGIEPVSAADAEAIAAAWGPSGGPPAAEARSLLAAAGARAVLTGTVIAERGSLRLRAELHVEPGKASAPHPIALNGRLSDAGAIAVDLASLAGEALTLRFPRTLRPPVPSPLAFPPARLEPSLGPPVSAEELARDETFMLAALRLDPKNADAHYQLGALRARGGDPAKGLEHMRAAAELAPQMPRYRWGLGAARLAQGSLEEARAEFQRSTEIDAGYVDGHLALAAVHLRRGDEAAAAEALRRAVEARPDDPRALSAAGVEAVRGDDPERARALFERARAASPRAVEPAVNLALLARQAGDLELARRELARALAADPANPSALMGLGVIEAEQGAPEPAAERFREAGARGAPGHVVLYNLGTLALGLGDVAEAESTLVKALDAAPDHAPTRVNLGLARLLDGRLEDALAAVDVGDDPSTAAGLAFFNAGFIHQVRREHPLALVDYLRALKGRGGLTDAHLNLGILFEAMGRPEKALAEYFKALSSEGALPRAYVWLGQVYAASGYPDMAAETMLKGTVVDASLPSPWHALATFAEATDRRKAAGFWRRFLDAVRRDRNRAFWIPYAEGRLRALGETP